MKLICTQIDDIKEKIPDLGFFLSITDGLVGFPRKVKSINNLSNSFLGCNRLIVKNYEDDNLSDYAINNINYQNMKKELDYDTIQVVRNKAKSKFVFVVPQSETERRWIVVTIDARKKCFANLGLVNGVFVEFIGSINTRVAKHPRPKRVHNIRIDTDGSFYIPDYEQCYSIEDSDNLLLIKFDRYRNPPAESMFYPEYVSAKLYNPHSDKCYDYTKLSDEIFCDTFVDLNSERPIDKVTEMFLLNRCND